LERGCNHTQERRSEKNAGDHFTNHSRLPDACDQLSDNPADQENDAELQEKLGRQPIHVSATCNIASISGGISMERMGSPAFLLTHFTLILPVATRVSPVVISD
jgi:hypothetical protein